MNGGFKEIVDIMSTRIGDCRTTKYMTREDSEAVPRITQILKASWDAAASMTVMEIELGCGEFKVTSSKYGATADEGEHDIVLLNGQGSPMQQQSTHIIMPVVQSHYYACCGMARLHVSLSSCLCCVQKVEGSGFELCFHELSGQELHVRECQEHFQEKRLPGQFGWH